jgi:hypothetical protein
MRCGAIHSCLLGLGLVLAACGSSPGSDGDTGGSGDGTTEDGSDGGDGSGDDDGTSGDGSGSDDGSTDDGTTSDTGEPIPDPEWDPEFTPPACSVDEDASLLEQVLALTDLTIDTFVFSEADLAESSYYSSGYLDDDFLLSWFVAARGDAARAGCIEGELAGPFDHYLGQPHPVAGMIRELAVRLDRPADDAAPFGLGDGGFDEALADLCAKVGDPCDSAEGEIPDDLGQALAPLLWAIGEGVSARLAMDAEPGGAPTFWRDNGGNILFDNMGPDPAIGAADERAYLLGENGRARLYRAASQVAFAIEDVDWSEFHGLMGVEYSLETNAGWILVRDAATQVYEDDGREVLLLVDLGGDDEHLDEVASNASAANPVSIVIDLGGADTYHYDEVGHEYDQDGLLPSDADGRAPAGTYDGNVTMSTRFRQGGARNGIAMLFDLGTEDDHYQSLRGSQGYAHQGVGVLFDAGGNDTYLSEAGSQGAAQFGIGLLVDAGEGIDSRRAFTYSQGFGFVAGAGALVDGGGDDVYDCDHGDPDLGGIPLYYSPQMAGQANSSFCQGVGFGLRGNTQNTHLSGGVGVLRDLGGDDQYDASTFAQGSGYWQGTGVLSDAGGSDRYDAYYYVQGGVAHYAVGILADAGDGNDDYNQTRDNVYMNMGSGHDFSLGVLIDEGGSDRYRITGLSTGASNCNGIGLFVDNGGDDVYTAVSDYSSGMGNHSSECINTRPNAVSIGVMLDAGGLDTYDYPQNVHDDFIVPTEGGTWGYSRNGIPAEHGAGLDGDGESGVHAESAGVGG